MDSTVLILMLTPILIPVALQLNIDLVHFGIVMVLTLTIGLLTPPEGAVLYIICTVFECRIWDFVKESACPALDRAGGGPGHLLAALALWLPNLIFGKG